MPNRVLYVGQSVEIKPKNGNSFYLPVQSASCEVTKPIEDILSFGRLGSLGRVQNAVSTCKSDLKSYIANNTGATGANQFVLNAAAIDTLTGQALNGDVTTITVTPNGFIMSGILTSLGIELSNGNFATMDLSFAGVGEPTFAAVPTGSNFSEQVSMPTGFSPVSSANVTGDGFAGCAASFKFNLDIPNEQLNCLGTSVTGTQSDVAAGFLMVGKPPFKATISVEGTAVTPPTTGVPEYQIGKLGIKLPAGQITSRSFNQAVGNVGATYNYTLEDVSAIFTDKA